MNHTESNCKETKRVRLVREIFLALKTVVVVVFLTVTLPLPIMGNGAQPTLPAVEISQPPVLDGDLSDPCWAAAPSVTDFYFPTDGSEAAETTTAWICYDQQNVYIAFDCRDSQPDKIVSQQKKRGGNISKDDWVGVDFDRYCDHERIIWFDVTAGGVQVERLDSGDGTKIEWRGDWYATAKRVDDGYVVEMAIPFGIFQYDARRASMGLAFLRRHARLDQQWTAPNVGPDWDGRRFYMWDGLRLPKTTSRPLALVYGLYGAGEEDIPAQVGLDVKHSLNETLTGVLTFNPDFRNVEQSVDSVDFTYTGRTLPDSRPFFQEGEDYFPGHDILYTRGIEKIDYGARLAGRVGDYNLGVMHAGRYGKEHHSVLKLRREWPAKAHLEFSSAFSEDSGSGNLVTHVNGAYRFYDKNDRKMQIVATLSTTQDDDKPGHGQRLEAGVFNSGRPRMLCWTLVRQRVEPDYYPRIGWWPETDVDGWHLDCNVYDEPSKGRMSYWTVSLNGKLLDHLDGSIYRNSLGASGGVVFRDGTSAWLSLDSTYRPPHKDRTARLSYSWGDRDLCNNGYIGIVFGRQASGDYQYYCAGQGWRLSEDWNLYSDYEWAQLEEPSPDAFSSSQFITTLSYDIDNERTVAGRFITRESKSNFYLAYRQRVRAGLDAYMIFGDPNAESTRSGVLLKLVTPLWTP